MIAKLKNRLPLHASAGLPLLIAVIILALGLASGITGCKATSETIERDGQQYFRHNGLNFELLVPEQWTARLMESDVAAELRAPAADSGETSAAPAVHVFSRHQTRGSDPEELVRAVSLLIQDQLAVLPGETTQDVEQQKVELAGRQAVKMSRQVSQGPSLIEQDLYVLHQQGGQVWVLVISVPADQRERWAADVEAIRRSFKVW